MNSNPDSLNLALVYQAEFLPALIIPKEQRITSLP